MLTLELRICFCWSIWWVAHRFTNTCTIRWERWFFVRRMYVSPSDFLERHTKIKSYQPFRCRNFLITHEFGQIFSSFVLKIFCSVKSWGYQTENDIFLDNMAFIWIKLSISTLKVMETLKTSVSNSHLSRSNTSGP